MNYTSIRITDQLYDELKHLNLVTDGMENTVMSFDDHSIQMIANPMELSQILVRYDMDPRIRQIDVD